MRRSRWLAPALLIALVLLLWEGGLVAISRAAGFPAGGDRYDVALWIATQLPRQWLDGPAQRLGGGIAPASDSQLLDFLSQASALAAAEHDLAYAQAFGKSDAGAEQTIHARLRSLKALAAPVEARLGHELTVVLQQEGLTTALPLFSDLQPVWPPVDFAYDLPPYVLVVSPRDRIAEVRTTLLRSDLTPAEIRRIEAQAERGGYSAIVVRVGGIATYPSIVEEDDNYAGTLDLIAHEWTHQYLFFHPLGVRYFSSPDLTTINETVANMSGQELSAAILARFPLHGKPTLSHSSAPPPDPAVNFDRTLHQLRVQVDALLKQGNVTQAEQQMNETQRFLAQHGYYIPEINQAYFAFYGTYANTAASTNPLGPEIATLRSRYASIGDFLHAVQNVTSVADLQRLLQQR